MVYFFFFFLAWPVLLVRPDAIVSLTIFKNNFSFIQISTIQNIFLKSMILTCEYKNQKIVRNLIQKEAQNINNVFYYRAHVDMENSFNFKGTCMLRFNHFNYNVTIIHLKTNYFEEKICIKMDSRINVTLMSANSNFFFDSATAKISLKENYNLKMSLKKYSLNPFLRLKNHKMLNNRKVVLSLTTNPSRIKKLHMVLRSVNLDLINVIYLNLPVMYRSNEQYTIPLPLFAEFPKLKILQLNHDIGSISKIFPSVIYESTIDERFTETIFISIDDDYIYTQNTIDSLIYNILITRKIIVLNTNGISNSSIYGETLGLGDDNSYYNLKGYCGAAYFGSHWPIYNLINFFSYIIQHNVTSCLQSDDFVISFFLRKNGGEIFKLSNYKQKYYEDSFLYHMDHFTDKYALHRTTLEGKRSKKSAHYPKYLNCYSYILNFLVNTRDLPKHRDST